MVDDHAFAARRVGRTLCDKYRLDALIGVGGMAAVYQGAHRNGHRVAVKVLHPALSVVEELRDRFLREGYAANAVPHPGAVRVLDDDIDEDGTVFLVMELLDGETVRELWENAGRVLPVRQVAHLSHQLLDVLWAAHANGIVHRDIKPDNLLVLRDGTLKVLDFGIACVRDSAGRLAAQTEGAMGTPGYMPREQALGLSDEIDPRTDLWSVGATMFALLTGRAPHRADTTEEVMAITATQAVTPLVELAPDVPPCIAAVVDRALATDMAERFQDAAGMQEALAEAYRSAFGESLPVGYLDVMAMKAALSSAPFRPTSTTGGLSAGRRRVSIAVPRHVSSRAVAWGGLGAGAVALAVLLVGLAGARNDQAPNTAAGLLENAPLGSSSVVELTAASAALHAVDDAAGASPSLATSDADSRPAQRRAVPAWRPVAPTIRVQPPPSAASSCDPPWTIDPITRGRKVKPGC
jgi:serine/threonine-protein kinase